MKTEKGILRYFTNGEWKSFNAILNENGYVNGETPIEDYGDYHWIPGFQIKEQCIAVLMSKNVAEDFIQRHENTRMEPFGKSFSIIESFEAVI